MLHGLGRWVLTDVSDEHIAFVIVVMGETSVSISQTLRCNIPENIYLRNHGSKNTVFHHSCCPVSKIF
jgi:hypothetical protein